MTPIAFKEIVILTLIDMQVMLGFATFVRMCNNLMGKLYQNI